MVLSSTSLSTMSAVFPPVFAAIPVGVRERLSIVDVLTRFL